MSRSFSSEFFADLFSTEFSVSCIVFLDDDTTRTSDFTKQGLDVEILSTSTPQLLRTLDRFLGITHEAPGPIALHCGPAGRAGALIATYLVRQLGFSADAAVAWLLMSHPALLGLGLPANTPCRAPAPTRRDLPAAILRSDSLNEPRGWRELDACRPDLARALSAPRSDTPSDTASFGERHS
jgi:hypothetical protein